MPIKQLRSKSNFQTRQLHSSNHNRITRKSIGQRSVSRSIQTKRPKKGPWWWRLTKKGMPLLIVLILLGGIGLVSAFAWYSRDLPDPNKIIERDLAQSTKIYDRTGEELLYEIHGDQRRTLVELEDIPQYAIDATIAVEDKNFFNHKGISLWGILRGQIMPRLQGKRAQGGSTLTQQFVKNAILTNERKLSRKIREWILSYRLEQKFSKEEILKLYFNEIPYGSTAYGIESASRIYFGKTITEITLPEAAILAALPQAPSYYSPYGPNKDLLLARKDIILDLMADQGYLTEDEVAVAKNTELKFNKKRDDIKAPHFVFLVQQELAERYGERLIEQGGLTIITTLDWDKQKIAEETVDEIAPTLEEQFGATNASLVSIDIESGDILSLIGSRDYFNDDIDGQVNVALALRQPGSSLKPLVYAQGFTKGYSPDTILFDLETSFAASGNEYKPKNYDLVEHGPVSVRQALAGSLNIPAVKMLYLAGVREVVDLAQKLGYSSLTDPNRYGLSLVLGGGEVRLLEHVNAYAAFGRDGVYQDYFSILEVRDTDGKVLEKKPEPKQQRVLDKEVIRNLTSVLADNAARSYAFGANNYLTLGGRPVAAKTGTTDDYRDAWLLGYTTKIATGVWVGNNDNTAMRNGSGSSAAGPIWNAYMRKVTAEDPIQNFPGVAKQECEKIMVCGLIDEEQVIRINKKTGQRATPFTPPGDIEEKTFREVHNILHYINKDSPLDSELPEDPTKDSQYSLWEEPVQRWAEEQGYLDELPPEEDDELYSPENQPKVTWVSPIKNSTITSNQFELKINSSAKRGVSKVDYFLDNIYIGTSFDSPFNLIVTTRPNWSNSDYNLRAKVYDDVGNMGQAAIPVKLDIDQVTIDFNITWLQPQPQENYTLTTIPNDIKFNINNLEQIKKIDFYFIHDNQTNWFGFEENITNSGITKEWSPNKGLGLYKIYLIITDVLGRVTASDELIINIK